LVFEDFREQKGPALCLASDRCSVACRERDRGTSSSVSVSYMSSERRP
jgi:hypothetical protein